MRRISEIGNLPGHMQVFAKELGGRFQNVEDTIFWEANSVKEFESKAVELGYEIAPPTVDSKTDRGFLVGFGVDEPERVDGSTMYASLRVYFVEADDHEITAWSKKIKEHRLMQEEDMRKRQEEAKKNPSRGKFRIFK